MIVCGTRTGEIVVIDSDADIAATSFVSSRPLLRSLTVQPRIADHLDNIVVATVGGNSDVDVFDIKPVQNDSALLPIMQENDSSINTVVVFDHSGLLMVTCGEGPVCHLYQSRQSFLDSIIKPGGKDPSTFGHERESSQRASSDSSPQITSNDSNVDLKEPWPDTSFEASFDWRPLKSLNSSCASMTGIAFDPSDRYVAACSREGIVVVWDLRMDGQICGTSSQYGGELTAIDFGRGGLILTASSDCQVQVWRVNQGIVSMKTSMRGHEFGVTCIALIHEERFGVSGSKDRSVRVWDLSAYSCVGLVKLNAAIFSMTVVHQFQNDVIYCGCGDGSIVSVIYDNTESRGLEVKEVIKLSSAIWSLGSTTTPSINSGMTWI